MKPSYGLSAQLDEGPETVSISNVLLLSWRLSISTQCSNQTQFLPMWMCLAKSGIASKVMADDFLHSFLIIQLWPHGTEVIEEPRSDEAHNMAVSSLTNEHSSAWTDVVMVLFTSMVTYNVHDFLVHAKSSGVLFSLCSTRTTVIDDRSSDTSAIQVSSLLTIPDFTTHISTQCHNNVL